MRNFKEKTIVTKEELDAYDQICRRVEEGHRFDELSVEEVRLMKKVHASQGISEAEEMIEVAMIEDGNIFSVVRLGGAFNIYEHKMSMIATMAKLHDMNYEDANKYLARMAIYVAISGPKSLLWVKGEKPSTVKWITSFPIGKGYNTSLCFSFFRLKICYSAEIVRWRAMNPSTRNLLKYQGGSDESACYVGQEYLYVAPNELVGDPDFISAIIDQVNDVRESRKRSRNNKQTILVEENLDDDFSPARLIGDILLTRNNMSEDDVKRIWGQTRDEIWQRVSNHCRNPMVLGGVIKDRVEQQPRSSPQIEMRSQTLQGTEENLDRTNI